MPMDELLAQCCEADDARGLDPPFELRRGEAQHGRVADHDLAHLRAAAP